MRKEYLIWAFEAIINNKLRAGLSMLWIIIWVASVIVMLSIWEWTKSDIVKRFESMGANVITLRAWWSSNVRSSWWTSSSTNVFDEDTVAFLSWIDWVSTVSPYVTSNKQIIYDTTNTQASIMWVLPVYKTLKSFSIQEGRFIQQEDIDENQMVAVVWNTLYKTLFGSWSWIWKDIKAQNTIFTVVWVLASNSNSDERIYVPLTTAQKKLVWSNYYSTIEIWVKDTTKMTQMMASIKSQLMEHMNVTDEDDAPFSVSSMSEMLSNIQQVTWTMTTFLAGIAAISLIVWWIWVMNIMLVSVTERTREIWIRKAIGACNWDILRQFLIESIFLSLFAGLIWIWLSLGIVAILKSFVTSVVTTKSITIAFVSAVSIWVFFWILPASKASKLKPVDALRYE